MISKLGVGTSLLVCASTARGADLIPGWGTKIPHAMGSGQKEQKNK